MTYSEKLKDQRWQKKRLKLLEACGWTCQHEFCINPKNKPTLHVHHKVYLRGHSPWDYEDWVYKVLCDECHEREQSFLEKAHCALAKNDNLAMLVVALDRMPEPISAKLSETLLALCQQREDLLESSLAFLEQLARHETVVMELGYKLGSKKP